LKMHKRSSSQEGYYGRSSRDREERGRGRNWRDHDREDNRSNRSGKKQRTDSSDTESHQDVQIIYKKVDRGRDVGDRSREAGIVGMYEEQQQQGSSRAFPHNPSVPGNYKYQRGKGLLGDAPQVHAGAFPLALHHPDFMQGDTGHDHYIDKDGQRVPGSILSKPPITSLLTAMSGSSESFGSRPDQVPTYHPSCPDGVRQAKKQTDGFWNLPPLPKKKKMEKDNLKAEEPHWKSQIKELRDYIDKLENEKKELVRDVETEKVQQLRDYIMKIEVEKQELMNRVEESKKESGPGVTNDNQMIELIKENIENVKQAQEKENRIIESRKVKLECEDKRLNVEKKKLEKAKEDLKTSLDNGMKFLSTEKTKMELEIQKKDQAKMRDNNRLLTKIKTLEKALKEEQNSRALEEKRHLATELEELETRKDMTLKTLESEAKVEELESSLEKYKNELYEIKEKMAKTDSENRKMSFEVVKVTKQNEDLESKLKATQLMLNTEIEKKNHGEIAQKQKFDAEYAVFVKKRDNFDESEKIRCVFCPQENLQPISNFIFHIAREHMFDQYKNMNIIDESLKVGMFFKVLEEKARKELGLEMKSLNESLDEMRENLFKQREEFEDRQVLLNESVEKATALERDIETLLESEANHKAQIEHLVLRNNTLQNQMRNTTASETIRIENQEMEKKIKCLGREVNDMKEKRLTIEREIDALRQRWKEESADKLGWKNRCGELTLENDNLRNRMEVLQNNKDNVKETLKTELTNANEEKANLRLKIRNFEEKIDELVSLKAVAESQLIEIKAENEAIKEFKSNLNAVNDLVCDDMQVENKTLKSKVSSGLNEIKNLKAEVSKLKTSKNFVVNELNISEKEVNKLKLEMSNLKNENISAHQRLTEAMEKIHTFEKDMEVCLKEQNELENDSSFTFDMGIDNILRAPLDVINLQIDNIDIDQLDNVELESEASIEQVCNLENEVPEEVEGVAGESVVLATVEIRLDDEGAQNMDAKDDEKKGSWSDDEFDYDLLNSSQEDSEVVSKSKDPHPLKCDCIDCELLKIGKEESNVMKGVECLHKAGCDCVECDDCDILHGFVEGEPHGIREMMRKTSLTK